MISRNIFIKLLVMTIVIFTVGCDSSIQSSPSSVAPTSTFEITPTITQFLPSLTLAPTDTPTQIPTLSPDEAYTRLHALLNDPVGCRLPCWLGVTPGLSNWHDADAQLISLSGIASGLYLESVHSKWWSSAYFEIPYSNDNMVIEVFQGYPTSSSDNIVSVVGAESRAYKLDNNGDFDGDVYGYSVYNELLKQYTVSGILSSFGQPHQIYLEAYLRTDTTITPGFGDHFDLHIWYPMAGIFMKYKMSVEGVGSNYRFCPANAFISGYSIAPSLRTNYQDALLELRDGYDAFFPPSPYVKTSEAAFGMTEEEFYQIFRSQTNHCLETPKLLWGFK